MTLMKKEKDRSENAHVYFNEFLEQIHKLLPKAQSRLDYRNDYDMWVISVRLLEEETGKTYVSYYPSEETASSITQWPAPEKLAKEFFKKFGRKVDL